MKEGKKAKEDMREAKEWRKRMKGGKNEVNRGRKEGRGN